MSSRDAPRREWDEWGVRRRVWSRRELLSALFAAGVSGCKVETIFNPVDTTGIPRFPDCDLNTDFIVQGAARDAVPPLDNPRWVRADQTVPAYLDPDTRVIGVHTFGVSYAIPHNVLWHHEVVNLDPGGPLGPRLGVTHCPLTGSSRVFDRATVGGARLGVSGLLFMNNLMFFDRTAAESAWPQMSGRAGCGARIGERMATVPFFEMDWAEWVSLYPETRVLAQDQGFDPVFFDYSALAYPYGPYREISTFWRPFTMPPEDTRRFSKEVVIGVPSEPGVSGIAFPYGAFADRGEPYQVVGFTHKGADALVLWSEQARGGMTFRPHTEGGATVTMRATQAGFMDDETGSSWTVDGLAIGGSRAGERLVAMAETYTAYWRAWAAFNPDTRLWV